MNYPCENNIKVNLPYKCNLILFPEPPQIFKDIFVSGNMSETVTRLEVISGQSFYMHCHPYGNPFPEVYWFKDDLPLRYILTDIIDWPESSVG